MRTRTWWLVLAMLLAAPASDLLAQRAPEKPTQAPARPKRPERERPTEEPRSCCRVCSKGKACGDSCIQRRLTCTKPPGCACNTGSR